MTGYTKKHLGLLPLRLMVAIGILGVIHYSESSGFFELVVRDFLSALVIATLITADLWSSNVRATHEHVSVSKWLCLYGLTTLVFMGIFSLVSWFVA